MANPKSARRYAQPLPQRSNNAARQRSASEGAIAASKKPEGGGEGAGGVCVSVTMGLQTIFIFYKITHNTKFDAHLRLHYHAPHGLLLLPI